MNVLWNPFRTGEDWNDAPPHPDEASLSAAGLDVEPSPENDGWAEGGKRAMKVLLDMLENGRRAERGAARRIMLSRSSEEDRALFGERLMDEIERERGWRQ